MPLVMCKVLHACASVICLMCIAFIPQACSPRAYIHTYICVSPFIHCYIVHKHIFLHTMYSTISISSISKINACYNIHTGIIPAGIERH